MKDKLSQTLGNIKKAKAEGDTRVDVHGQTLVWTQYKPGKFDWRMQKDDAAPKPKPTGDPEKDAEAVQQELSKKEAATQRAASMAKVETLVQWASKPQNDPTLRQISYDELVKRGEDVSEINLMTGRYLKEKQLFGGDDEEESNFSYNIKSDSVVPKKIWDKVKLVFPDGDIDYKNKKLISTVFNNLNTKAERIQYDNFVDEVKRSDDYYMPPKQEIHDMNKQVAAFIANKSPFLIISGGAGVGKSYNFKGVADIMQKRQFDPSQDQAGDGDYDFVEVGEVNSANQLIELLRKHNGKLILFDDADTGLLKKECLNVLKKATNPSGVRYVGKESGEDAGTFEFTGQIAMLTNKGQNELTSDDDRLAVFSRALKRDLYFTKSEQMEFMKPLIHHFEFDDTPRLLNVQDDMDERNEIFQMMEDNFDRIDPVKMNSRFLRELIQEKRSEDNATNLMSKNAGAAKFFGTGSDWKRKLEAKLVKGDSIRMSVKDALEVLKIKTHE